MNIGQADSPLLVGIEDPSPGGIEVVTVGHFLLAGVVNPPNLPVRNIDESTTGCTLADLGSVARGRHFVNANLKNR